MQRLALFVDVGNLYHTCIRKFNKKVNFKKLFDFCTRDSKVTHAIAYGVGASNNRNFKRCLYEAGFKKVDFKTPKAFSDGSKKADQDPKIFADIFRYLDDYDVLVLCTADGDFADILQIAAERGKTISIVGCGISHELKAITNLYWEIGEDLLEPTNAT